MASLMLTVLFIISYVTIPLYNTHVDSDYGIDSSCEYYYYQSELKTIMRTFNVDYHVPTKCHGYDYDKRILFKQLKHDIDESCSDLKQIYANSGTDDYGKSFCRNKDEFTYVYIMKNCSYNTSLIGHPNDPAKDILMECVNNPESETIR